MKKIIVLTLFISSVISMFAGDYILFYKNDNSITTILQSQIDSITFNSDETQLFIHKSDNSTIQYTIAEIDSIKFETMDDNTVKIIYTGNNVNVINPLENDGVIVSVSNADVIVNSTIEENITYDISGSTTDGMFKIYSENKYTLNLNGVSITNSDGPAINIQSGKKCTINLVDGTTNTLADGTTYADSEEDQKATLFSEGQIIFTGEGTLNVSSFSKHAIASDEYIYVESGNINVTAAGKDAVHAKEYFKMSDGALSLSSLSDGIDSEGYIDISGGSVKFTSYVADIKGINADSTITVSGGNINLTIGGNQSKAIASDMDMTLSGGTYTINTSGSAVLEPSGSGYDPSYCTAIKSKQNVNISSGTFTITATGAGGKGISSDGDINISGGNITIITSGGGATYTNSTGTTDAYAATCLTSDSDINIIDGTVTLSSTGQAGKGISADGSFTMGSSSTEPALSITTTGSDIATTSGSTRPGSTTTTTTYASAKALKADVDIVINSGAINISSADDGMKSENSVTINGGTINITKSYEGIESLIIYMNGGYVNVTASDDGINGTEGTEAGGTEKTDKSYFYMNGGTMIAGATSGDAIDVNGTFKMTGGNLIAFGPANSTNEDLDVNGTITVNGGTFFGACYNSNMFETSVSSSGQVGVILKSSSSVASANLYFNIQDASGNTIGTFMTPRTAYYFHFCSPLLQKSTSYKVYTGGSYTGGTTYGNLSTGGYCTGGTYNAGSLKKSFSTGTSTISSISF